ncbi:MAG: phosphotransferase [Lacipirellulaceae bacterium]
MLRALGWQTTGWAPVPGGLSGARVWRRGADSQPVALKRYPAGSIDEARLDEVACVVARAAYALGGRLPVPAFAIGHTVHRCQGPDGAWWEGTRWLPGAPTTRESAPAVLAALGLLHDAWRRTERGVRGVSTALRDRERGLAEPTFHGPQPSHPEHAALVAALRDAAQAVRPRALAAVKRVAGLDLPLHRVHGDLRPDHALVSLRSDEVGHAVWEVTGWLDFTATRIDTQLVDVARLAGELAAGDAAVRDELARQCPCRIEPDLACETVAALDLGGAVVAAERWGRWIAEGRIAKGEGAGALARVQQLTKKLTRHAE